MILASLYTTAVAVTGQEVIDFDRVIESLTRPMFHLKKENCQCLTTTTVFCTYQVDCLDC